jgi:hypothetical protein
LCYCFTEEAIFGKERFEMGVFLAGKRTGYYWESLQKSLELISRVSLDINAEDERKFEDRLSGALQPNFKDFIDQRNNKQVMTRITAFNHDHRPDMSISDDGVAMEVKVLRSGSSVREALGQALIYRLGYRFVIIIWVDATKDKEYKTAISKTGSVESGLIAEMQEMNIFCVVK